MTSLNSDHSENSETLEHLLSIVNANREQQCNEVRGHAHQQANELIKQAHSRVRGRLHRHIIALREKYRLRISAARAHNHTLIRQQHQQADSVFLETAWPALRTALLALWKDPASKKIWITTAIGKAAVALLQQDWIVEYPQGLTDEELDILQQSAAANMIETAKLQPRDDIEAGIRINAHGTVIDATLDGLLQKETKIQAAMIAQFKHDQ